MLALNDCLSLDVFPESAQEAAAAGSSLPVIRDVITTDEAVICEFERNINDTEGGGVSDYLVPLHFHARRGGRQEGGDARMARARRL